MKNLSFGSLLLSVQSVIDRFALHFSDLLLLVLRGYFGYRFVTTGIGKLSNLDAVATFFGGLGIPFPLLNAALAGTTEVVVGALLLIGFYARYASIPLIATMIVAYFTAHPESVATFFSLPGKFFRQEPFPFLLTSLIVFAFGAGKWSVDHLRRK